jgi:DNA-directed RNA polymerase specialized sigma24 family protein
MVSTSLPVAPTPFDSLDPSEASLVRAARHNPAAFAQLYRAYLRPFFGYTLARVGNGVEAEDLTSQTLSGRFRGN